MKISNTKNKNYFNITAICLYVIIIIIIGSIAFQESRPALSIGAGSGTEEPCTYYIYSDGTYFYSQNCSTGIIDYGGSSNNGGVNGNSFSSVLNKAIVTVNSTTPAGGEIQVGIMNAQIDQQINLAPKVQLDFTNGGIFTTGTETNVFSGIGLQGGGDYTGQYHLNLWADFQLSQPNQIFLNLLDPAGAIINIGQVHSQTESIIPGQIGIRMFGSNQAFYSTIFFQQAYHLDRAIDLEQLSNNSPNGSIVESVSCADVNYCVYVGNKVFNTNLMNVIIETAGVNIAGVYMDGINNHIGFLYGEYGQSAPLLKLDSDAYGNFVDFVKQNGAGKSIDITPNTIGANIIHTLQPTGYITNPFGISTIGGGGNSNSPSPSTDYLSDDYNLLISCNGGTNVSISIKDRSGYIMSSGITCSNSMTPINLPAGFKINFGPFTGVPPTVNVFGIN